MKVAWHEVPGKSVDTIRPVGNGVSAVNTVCLLPKIK
jgi:hypothetical protein